MRRLGNVGLDAFQFHGLNGVGLARDFFFQAFEEFALFQHDLIQLVHLMFQVGDIRFKFFHPLLGFVSHGADIGLTGR